MIYEIYCKTCGETRKINIPKDEWKEAQTLFSEASEVLTHQCSGQYELRRHGKYCNRKNKKAEASTRVRPVLVKRTKSTDKKGNG